MSAHMSVADARQFVARQRDALTELTKAVGDVLALINATDGVRRYDGTEDEFNALRVMYERACHVLDS